MFLALLLVIWFEIYVFGQFFKTFVVATPLGIWAVLVSETPLPKIHILPPAVCRAELKQPTSTLFELICVCRKNGGAEEDKYKD